MTVILATKPRNARGRGGERRRRLAARPAFHAPLAGAALLLLLAGCQTRPGAEALGTNVPLAPAKGTAGPSTPGTVVWRSPDLPRFERGANTYYIPPATVYRGPGSDYTNLSQQQTEQVAAELTADVRSAVGHRFKLVNQPGPGAFTLQLILAKLVPPQPMAIQNGPYDWSASVVGMPDVPSMSTGVMTVSGKISDGASGKLLAGFVAPVTPQNLSAEATDNPAESVSFAKIASERFASDLVAAIVRTRELNRQASNASAASSR